jgi:hypothetical protein
MLEYLTKLNSVDLGLLGNIDYNTIGVIVSSSVLIVFSLGLAKMLEMLYDNQYSFEIYSHCDRFGFGFDEEPTCMCSIYLKKRNKVIFLKQFFSNKGYPLKDSLFFCKEYSDLNKKNKFTVKYC